MQQNIIKQKYQTCKLNSMKAVQPLTVHECACQQKDEQKETHQTHSLFLLIHLCSSNFFFNFLTFICSQSHIMKVQVFNSCSFYFYQVWRTVQYTAFNLLHDNRYINIIWKQYYICCLCTKCKQCILCIHNGQVIPMATRINATHTRLWASWHCNR